MHESNSSYLPPIIAQQLKFICDNNNNKKKKWEPGDKAFASTCVHTKL